MSIGTAPPPNHNLPFLSCRLNGFLISFLRSFLFAFIRSKAFLLEAYERYTTLPIAKRLQKKVEDTSSETFICKGLLITTGEPKYVNYKEFIILLIER